ncbi:MAG: fimbrial protein [Bacteroidales bacterium]|nr:fimbrial protein [Bacteroidales bacterium]
MNKNLLFLTLAAIALAGSCSKQEPVSTPQQNFPEAVATLSVALRTPLTKSSQTAQEEAVSSLDVFVFNEDGSRVEASAHGSSTSVDVSVSIGTKVVAALVNYSGEIPSFVSVSDLEEIVSDLSDNTPSKFVMYGKTGATAVTTSSAVTVEVSRLVARVKLGQVINALTGPYEGEQLQVSGAYLINVAGESLLGGSSAVPSKWYNKQKNCSELPSLLNAGTQMNFYCYPNSVSSDSSSKDWSPRYTRLVVEAVIAGHTWYYPINLPLIKANCSYEIPSLTITRLGSTDPDTPIEVGTASFTVEVKDWTVVPKTEVTI